MSVADNVKRIREHIAEAAVQAGVAPDTITLVAASKTKPPEQIREAIEAGIHVLGENRVQEMVEKAEQDAYIGASLHLIGHLQKNKVNKVVGLASLIESVDSLELLKVIGSRAKALGISQDVLLQINVGAETSKSGAAMEEIPEILEETGKIESVSIRGLMAIPPISTEKGGNKRYFEKMRELFIDIGQKKYDNVSMDFLSMGMSGDYTDAILSGANMIRIGSAIFGTR